MLVNAVFSYMPVPLPHSSVSLLLGMVQEQWRECGLRERASLFPSSWKRCWAKEICMCWSQAISPVSILLLPFCYLADGIFARGREMKWRSVIARGRGSLSSRGEYLLMQRWQGACRGRRHRTAVVAESCSECWRDWGGNNRMGLRFLRYCLRNKRFSCASRHLHTAFSPQTRFCARKSILFYISHTMAQTRNRYCEAEKYCQCVDSELLRYMWSLRHLHCRQCVYTPYCQQCLHSFLLLSAWK